MKKQILELLVYFSGVSFSVVMFGFGLLYPTNLYTTDCYEITAPIETKYGVIEPEQFLDMSQEEKIRIITEMERNKIQYKSRFFHVHEIERKENAGIKG